MPDASLAMACVLAGLGCIHKHFLDELRSLRYRLLVGQSIRCVVAAGNCKQKACQGWEPSKAANVRLKLLQGSLDYLCFFSSHAGVAEFIAGPGRQDNMQPRHTGRTVQGHVMPVINACAMSDSAGDSAPGSCIGPNPNLSGRKSVEARQAVCLE